MLGVYKIMSGIDSLDRKKLVTLTEGSIKRGGHRRNLKDKGFIGDVRKTFSS